MCAWTLTSSVRMLTMWLLNRLLLLFFAIFKWMASWAFNHLISKMRFVFLFNSAICELYKFIYFRFECNGYVAIDRNAISDKIGFIHILMNLFLTRPMHNICSYNYAHVVDPMGPFYVFWRQSINRQRTVWCVVCNVLVPDHCVLWHICWSTIATSFLSLRVTKVTLF